MTWNSKHNWYLYIFIDIKKNSPTHSSRNWQLKWCSSEVMCMSVQLVMMVRQYQFSHYNTVEWLHCNDALHAERPQIIYNLIILMVNTNYWQHVFKLCGIWIGNIYMTNIKWTLPDDAPKAACHRNQPLAPFIISTKVPFYVHIYTVLTLTLQIQLLLG